MKNITSVALVRISSRFHDHFLVSIIHDIIFGERVVSRRISRREFTANREETFRGGNVDVLFLETREFNRYRVCVIGMEDIHPGMDKLAMSMSMMPTATPATTTTATSPTMPASETSSMMSKSWSSRHGTISRLAIKVGSEITCEITSVLTHETRQACTLKSRAKRWHWS